MVPVGGKVNANKSDKIEEKTFFDIYQSNAIFEQGMTGKEIKFKSLKEYINGKLTKTGTALISDKAAEQASDETAIAGDELDIQQAEKKAKNM